MFDAREKNHKYDKNNVYRVIALNMIEVCGPKKVIIEKK